MSAWLLVAYRLQFATLAIGIVYIARELIPVYWEVWNATSQSILAICHKSTKRKSSINNILPPEIINQIFRHLARDSGPLELRYAFKVCRLWHDWICGAPNLWTCININDALLVHLLDHPASSAQQYARACISRSKGRPLSLLMDNMSIVLYLKCGGHSGQARSVFRAIAGEFDKNSGENGNAIRLYSFILNCGRPSVDYTVVQWLTSLKNQSIAHVELHNCKGRTTRHPVTMFRFTNRIVIVDPRWESHPSGQILYANEDSPAEILTFQRSGFWYKEDLEHFSIYHNLTDLHLVSRPGKNDNSFMSLSGFFVGPVGPSTLVTLPNVERLFLTGDVPAGVLKSLDLPALTGVRIQEYRYRHTLRSLLGTMFCRLIQDIWLEFPSRNVDVWVLPLAGVIEQATGLKTLTVTPWMERTIRGILDSSCAFTIVIA
jgi:hypothetical protein